MVKEILGLIIYVETYVYIHVCTYEYMHIEGSESI